MLESLSSILEVLGSISSIVERKKEREGIQDDD
jgi:hypothetical protein